MRKNSGISLVALVVTIIVLIIIAGISISLVLGPKGILEKAKQSEKNYIEASKQEEKDLDELYSSILVATGDNSKITISVEDLKTIIQKEVEETTNKIQEEMNEKINQIQSKGITGFQKLLHSTNESCDTGTISLSSFSKSFSGRFSDCFDYQSSNGNLVCKEAGWYILQSQVYSVSTNYPWRSTRAYISINEIVMLECLGTPSNNSHYCSDTQATTVYLNEGDVLGFFRSNNGSNFEQCNTSFAIFKI